VRLLADENMPFSIIAELRSHGYDVLSVKESLSGRDDESILEIAQTESRLVLTQDKDFGELAFRMGSPATCGVILFRLDGEDLAEDHNRMLEVIEGRADWSGIFGVATNRRVRIRFLPPKDIIL
jgi:predicted nuclease of predicted toxin-antitoxin system